jgi:hypothetical protein
MHGKTAFTFDESLISNHKSLGRDLNCQLEAAGIAGTRTPSAAAFNYQLGWISASLVFLKQAG